MDSKTLCCEEDASSVPRHLELGVRLRKIRKEKALTLADVGERSGLATSTISRAERGLIALTYDKLLKVVSGLGVDLSTLLGPPEQQSDHSSIGVARIGEFQLLETDTYRYELLFPERWSKGMTPMTGVVKARSRAEFSELIRHPGQEFLYVLSGQLTVHTDNNPPVTLNPGESVYFDSNMGHIYTSTGNEECRILVVCKPE